MCLGQIEGQGIRFGPKSKAWSRKRTGVQLGCVGLVWPADKVVGVHVLIQFLT